LAGAAQADLAGAADDAQGLDEGTHVLEVALAVAQEAHGAGNDGILDSEELVAAAVAIPAPQIDTSGTIVTVSDIVELVNSADGRRFARLRITYPAPYRFACDRPTALTILHGAPLSAAE
jgi:hypothetical protein